MSNPSAIYEMAPTGVDGALEASGQVHFYCSHGHAEADFEEGAFDGMAVSGPESIEFGEVPDGTVCERCEEPIPTAEAPAWEVRITYTGSSTYFVRATTQEKAEEAARARYLNGDNGDPTGGESEEIIRVEAEEVTPPPDDETRLGMLLHHLASASQPDTDTEDFAYAETTLRHAFGDALVTQALADNLLRRVGIGECHMRLTTGGETRLRESQSEA